MEEMELAQEKKDQLIQRVTELLEQGILKVSDWMAIYDILLEACHREEIMTMEQYLIDSINERDEEE